MLKKTVLVHALALAFGGMALTVGVVQPAMAQSNAAGVVFGHVEGATSDASIALLNTETGLRRTATIDAKGRYQATALPVGHYRVELVQGGKVARTTEVDVLLGQGVDASFLGTQTVQVTGRRARIDVSNATNGQVFSARELAKLPVQQNLAQIVLLAPNTTAGDQAFGKNVATIGGGAASENSYYLNGFPITNPLSQLGSMELPFGAIQQASVLTGGFGAEFGRSIGGVLNVQSKSGTNNWEAGATYSLTPDSMRSKRKNIYFPVTGDENNAKTDGKLHWRQDNRETTSRQYGAYVGGPIIKDKLFMFVAADRTVTDDNQVGPSAISNPATIGEQGWYANREGENRWLGKLDWNITDNHRLEFTSAGDDYKKRYDRYGYTLNPNNPNAATLLDGQPNGQLYSSAQAHNLGPTDPAYPGTPGATLNSLRYIGQINDDLTVTALYGEMKTQRGTVYNALGANSAGGSVLPPTITTTLPQNQWSGVPSSLYRNYNFFSGYRSSPGEDTVKSGRLDLEYKLGSHTLRAGFDQSKLDSSTAGQQISGGTQWSYRFVGAGKANVEVPLSNSRPGIVANYGGSGAAGYYARALVFNSVTAASSKQSAQYIEDRWQATKDLLLTIGLRNDSYSNTNGDGEKFIDMSHQIAPRLAASWDVNGDASFKVYGSLGRYYLQLPTQVAARAASRSTYTQQDFTYTGIDPRTGAPLGLVAINTPNSANGEYGQAKDVRSVVDQDLKPNYQDEFTVGFERAWSANLNFGGRFTYRKLGAGIDDTCDARLLAAFADQNGIPVGNPGALGCQIFNPGRGMTVFVNGNDVNGNIVPGTGKWAHFTSEQMGYPDADRKYAAIDLFVEHPMRDGWYGRINYTLSRSKGNMEGQTRSDSGQTDVGTSAGWDFPEFMVGSNGLLPNDRLHQFKAFGFYQLTPEWTVGGNLLVQSGRPRMCYGNNNAVDAGEPGAGEAWLPGYQYYSYGGPGYASEYYFCNGQVTERGSQGRMPWEKRLDLNLTYSPSIIKGLAVKVDVFNALNSQNPLAEHSEYSAGDQNVIASDYREVRYYQTPRSMRFTVEYNHKF
jgi:hypothetical protein